MTRTSHLARLKASDEKTAMMSGQTWMFANGDTLTLRDLYKENGRWIWECDGCITQSTGEVFAQTCRPFASILDKARKAGTIKKVAA